MSWLCNFLPCRWIRICNVLVGAHRSTRKRHSHGQAGLYQCTRCKAVSFRSSTQQREERGNTMTVRIQRNPQAVWRAIKTYGTQEKMAADLGVEQTTVSAWGKGDRPVPFAFCVRIEASTRRIAKAKHDQALIVKCEELQPDMDWRELLALAKLRLAEAA